MYPADLKVRPKHSSASGMCFLTNFVSKMAERDIEPDTGNVVSEVTCVKLRDVFGGTSCLVRGW